MNDDSVKQRQQLEAQVERWTTEAKKLSDAGDEEGALALYRKAADELPGAPWLQHRTAELARKLKKSEVAILYFRRAATAFQLADFAKRAVAPLRTAWTLAVEGLPGSSKALVDLSLELMQVHRRLGFAADAAVTLERTNAALRTRGFSEISPHALEAMDREPTARRLAARASEPPSSRPLPNPATTTSAIAPRSAGALADASQDARNRALARKFGRG